MTEEQNTTATPPPTTAVAEYTATEAALGELRGRLKDVVHDVTTTKGMEAAKKDRAEVRGLRTALEAKRKEIKAPALERCRLIDAEAQRITAALLELEEPIDAQIKAEEKRKADEKAAKEEAERKRVAAIRERIDGMRDATIRASGKDSKTIEMIVGMLSDTAIDESFSELAAEAEGVKQGTLTKLREMLAAAEAQEAEAKRLAEQRAELARQEKEAAERRAAERRAQEEEAARIRAQQEAEAARLKAEREAFERQQAEASRKAEEERAEADRKAAAEREEADRIAREKREAEEREAKARRDEEERIAREAREAEERRIAAERAELDRQRAEQEARERAERERRESEEAERRRREFLASLAPPTAEQVAELVAGHFAGDDIHKAADWLADMDFKALVESLAVIERAA